MTIFDMDWGNDEWDVDKKAESLNKALFGKRKKNLIRADKNAKKNEADFGKDSDDDNDEKLSKKAKKKLKERKRKENKKNTKDASCVENGDQSSAAEANGLDEENGNVKTKSAKSQPNTSPNKKQKGKSKDTKLEPETKTSKEVNGKMDSSVGGDNEQEVLTKKKRKRKTSQVNDDGETIPTTKQKTEADQNPDSDKEDEPKKKRKRRKKKKPNSKKNKYLHLVKPKSAKSASSGSDSDDESSDEGNRGTQTKIATVKPVVKINEVKRETNKKRKRSESPEKVPVKKSKITDDSEKASQLVKAKKSTKTQVDILKEKKYEGDNGVITDKSNLMKKGKTSRAGDVLEEQKTGNNSRNKLKNESVNKMEVGNKPTGSSLKKLKGEKSEDAINVTMETSNVLQKGKKAKSGDVSVQPGPKSNNKSKNEAANTIEVDNPSTNISSKISRKEKRKARKLEGATIGGEPPTPSPFLQSSQGSELQQKMVDKLASARFRFINEQLYTIKGGEALQMFKQDKTLMRAYNTGFQGQVKHWPVNPLDIIIKQLSNKGAKLIVADFGCGEARLSKSVPQKVHSFDLCSLNKRVTVCDMAKTPLASGSVDIAVFCLSLMGTNLNDYLLEANRVLKDGGYLKIAEVVSRFTNPNHFTNAVSSVGFKVVNMRELSTMFYLMDFKKVKTMDKVKNTKPVTLKPCLYKKR